MCGIVGYTGAKGASELLLSSLELLEHRGYDSVGIACRDSETDEVCIQKCVGRVRDLRAECEANPVLSTCGIGHTRWATHGGVYKKNAHPPTESLAFPKTFCHLMDIPEVLTV